MVVEEELVRAPRSKKFDKFLVDRYLSIPGQISRSDTSCDCDFKSGFDTILHLPLLQNFNTDAKYNLFGA